MSWTFWFTICWNSIKIVERVRSQKTDKRKNDHISVNVVKRSHNLKKKKKERHKITSKLGLNLTVKVKTEGYRHSRQPWRSEGSLLCCLFCAPWVRWRSSTERPGCLDRRMRWGDLQPYKGKDKLDLNFHQLKYLRKGLVWSTSNML